MGYNIANGATPTVAANGFGGLQVINVNQMALQASPSTKAKVAANLDPSAAIIAGPPGPGAYTSKTSVVTYDNIGNAVTVDVYARRPPRTPGRSNSITRRRAPRSRAASIPLPSMSLRLAKASSLPQARPRSP